MDSQDEILIIVDTNDNIIKHLSRKLVHQQKLLHRTVSIAVYNSKGEILLHKRSMNKDSNPGKWGNASGGHVTRGKSYEQIAKKELIEELNINTPLTLIKKMIINDPVHTTMTCIYKTTSEGPFNFNKEEIEEIKFFSKEKLKDIKSKLSKSARIILKEQGLL